MAAAPSIVRLSRPISRPVSLFFHAAQLVWRTSNACKSPRLVPSMSIVFTSIARVKDWKAVQRLNREILVGRAREAGATRYRLYRNVKDASQVLVLAECPDDDAVQELSRDIGDQLGAGLHDGAWDDRAREAIDCEGIAECLRQAYMQWKETSDIRGRQQDARATLCRARPIRQVERCR